MFNEQGYVIQLLSNNFFLGQTRVTVKIYLFWGRRTKYIEKVILGRTYLSNSHMEIKVYQIDVYSILYGRF